MALVRCSACGSVCASAAKNEVPETGRLAVVMFADIIGSVDFADALGSKDYQRLLREFRHNALDVCCHLNASGEQGRYQLDGRPQVRGDELCLLILCPKDDAKSDIGVRETRAAVRLAREMKIRWLTSPFNWERVSDGKRPIDIAIGINIGRVQDIESGTRSGVEQWEGHAISLAKRVEGAAREHGRYTRIMLSRRAHQVAVVGDLKVHWAEPRAAELRGLSREEELHEIRCFYEWVYWDELESVGGNLEEYRRLFIQDYSNSWLGVMVATSYFYRGNLDQALDIIQKVLWVNGDIPVAWLLLGKCYLQDAAMVAGGSPQACESRFRECRSFYEKAEDVTQKALRLDDSSEDAYVELGCIYYLWAAALEELGPDLSGGGMSDIGEVRRKALSCFRRGAAVGVGKIRAAFWIWAMDIQRCAPEGGGCLVALAHDLGWVNRDASANDVVCAVMRRYEGYSGSVGLAPYLLNVRQCLAAFLAGQTGILTIPGHESAGPTTGVALAKQILEEAVRDAVNLQSEMPGLFVFSTGRRLAPLVPISCFVDDCRQMLRGLDQGEAR